MQTTTTKVKTLWPAQRFSFGCSNIKSDDNDYLWNNYLAGNMCKSRIATRQELRVAVLVVSFKTQNKKTNKHSVQVGHHVQKCDTAFPHAMDRSGCFYSTKQMDTI